jgi:hypothetical protein
MLELLTEIDCSCSHVFVLFYLMPNRLKVEWEIALLWVTCPQGQCKV